jgi:tRNA U34 5-carboxymethylaminomethyl modifying GTPase MnmE/TrmE
VPNFATQNIEFEQWTGTNLEAVADLIDSINGTERLDATVDSEGALHVTFPNGGFERIVTAGHYVVVTLDYHDNDMPPARFARWFDVI